MSPYQHIVVGVELSAHSHVILEEALRLARRHQARLSLLHVIENHLPQHWEFLPFSPSEFEESLKHNAQTWMDEQLAALDTEGVTLERHILLGRAYEELLGYGEREHADLFVIGQTETTLLERLFLGNTAKRIVRRASQSVMVVHAKKKPTRNILVALDFSETSRWACEVAISHARAEGASLHLAHVYELFSVHPFTQMLGDEEIARYVKEVREPIRKEFETFVASLELEGISHELHLRDGFVQDEIRHLQLSLSCDLLVIGSVGRTGLRALLLGNTAEHLLNTPACSILVTKPQHQT